MSHNDNDILRIAKHLLLSSNPGQFDIILSDLNIILNSNNNGSINTTTTSKNQDAKSHVSSMSSSTLLTKHNIVTTNSIFSKEWIQQTRSEYEMRTGRDILRFKEEEEEDGGRLDDEGKNNSNENENVYSIPSLQKALSTYLEKYYKSQDIQSNIHVTGDENSIIILLYAERIHLSHYHTGRQTAKYEITLPSASSSSNQCMISGLARLHGHTFESGNFQIKSTIHLKPTPLQSATSTTSFINEVISTIGSFEQEHIVKPLHEMYENVNQQYLKQLRRVMTLTRTKFDWNVVNHKLRRNLGSDVTAHTNPSS